MNHRRRFPGPLHGVPSPEFSCEQYEDALSAMADNEPAEISATQLRRHLAACAACRSFNETLGSVIPASSMAAVNLASDMPSRVERLAARADRQGSPDTIRFLLVGVATSIVLLSIPELFTSDSSAAVAHNDRHLGSFSAAYGVLLLVTAIRPARARTALPVSVVLASAIGISAVSDLIHGNIPLVGEALHLPELASVALVWLLARRTSLRS